MKREAFLQVAQCYFSFSPGSFGSCNAALDKLPVSGIWPRPSSGQMLHFLEQTSEQCTVCKSESDCRSAPSLVINLS